MIACPATLIVGIILGAVGGGLVTAVVLAALMGRR